VLSRRRRQGVKAGGHKRFVLFNPELNSRSTTDTTVPRKETGHDGPDEHNCPAQESRKEVWELLKDLDTTEKNVRVVLRGAFEDTTNNLGSAFDGDLPHTGPITPPRPQQKPRRE
jgi:hypothetical protein